jgi:hypothetical protein
VTSGFFRSPVPAIVSLAAAALGLGIALQINDGFYEPRALQALSVALVFAIGGVLIMPGDGLVRGRVALVHIALGAAIGVQLLMLYRATPGMYLEEGARLDLFAAGVAIEAALVAVGTLGLRWFTRWWFPAVLVVNIALGVWMLRASPHPKIDVVEVHNSAFQALARGRSPYRITFRNIYGPDTGFYNPQAVSGDRVLIGYPYPPLSLLIAAPGQVIFRDYRYAELAAFIGAAALIGYAGVSLGAKLAAVMLLTTPRAFFVLEQGWTEPIGVLMLAAMTWAMIRRPAWCPWVGGLLAVTKQYFGLAGPLLWRFARSRPEGAWRFLARAIAAGALVTLPFALRDVRAFVDTVILLQTKEPFRIDSLSFVSWAARAGWGQGSFLWAVGAGLVALTVVMWRTPNNAAGFAGGLALSAFALFAMGSKAFCNYYFFVIGALCCTMAALIASAEEAKRA